MTAPAGVRVLLFHSTSDASGVRSAYHQVSQALAGVPGLVGDELLGSLSDPHSFVVLSSWASLDHFLAWERTSGHRTATAPLRPYRDTASTRPFDAFVVLAAYRTDRSRLAPVPVPERSWLRRAAHAVLHALTVYGQAMSGSPLPGQDPYHPRPGNRH